MPPIIDEAFKSLDDTATALKSIVSPSPSCRGRLEMVNEESKEPKIETAEKHELSVNSTVVQNSLKKQHSTSFFNMKKSTSSQLDASENKQGSALTPRESDKEQSSESETVSQGTGSKPRKILKHFKTQISTSPFFSIGSSKPKKPANEIEENTPIPKNEKINIQKRRTQKAYLDACRR